MTVQIHELIIRASVGGRDVPGEQHAEFDKKLQLMREEILRECLKQARQLLANPRSAR